MYNLLKIAQTEDKEAIHYCDYHLLSLAIAVVTVTFVLIIFTLFCYAVLWFIHDKMENSEKFKDYVIESEIDRRKSPAGIMGRWWTGTCFMLPQAPVSCYSLRIVVWLTSVFRHDTRQYTGIWLAILYEYFVICLLYNVLYEFSVPFVEQFARCYFTGKRSKHNVRATFYLRMLGGYMIKNIDLNL